MSPLPPCCCNTTLILCDWIIRFPVLTPSLQHRYHTGGKQNTCWLKPDKATLGFRSCTANRSYLYAAPGSRSNPERDEFTPAQTCKAASTFPFPQRFLLRQYLQLLTAVPPQLPHKGCLAAGLWWADTLVLLLLWAQAAESTAGTGRCSAACSPSLGHVPSALPQLWHEAGSRQCSSSSCTSQTAQIVQLGLLHDCDQEYLTPSDGLSGPTRHSAFIWRWWIHLSPWWPFSLCFSPHCSFIPSHFPLAAVSSGW